MMKTYRPAFLFLSFASALLIGVAPSAAAGSGKASRKAEAAAPTAQPDECALRYHASLVRIGKDDLPLLRSGGAEAGTTAAPIAETSVDPALPGVPLFVAPPRQRSRAEVSALTAAVALARTRGRSTAATAGNAPVDRRWLAARLREDLGDYLNQKPTPYLCGGVPAYVEMLRSFAGRLGPVGDHRAEWTATQRLAAENAVRAAGEAISRAKAPAAPPASQADLRPAAGIARTDAAPAPAAPVPPLDDDAGRLAAIDGLVSGVKAANLVADLPVPAVTSATASPPPPPRPVLAKLAEARPLVTSARPLIRDRVVRLKLLTAFSELEMLDYLAHAGSETPDPLASAIGRTLADIEAAHRTDCTCAGVRP